MMDAEREPTSRRAQVARLRRVALAALRRYPLPDGMLRFVTHGENTTFRHDSAAGSYLVRVHRPERHGQDVDSVPAIESEIAWMHAIRHDTGLETPRALTADGGGWTVRATDGELTRVCSVLEWMPGRIHENSARPIHLERVGRALATIHAQADVWETPPGFTRIRWDADAFFGDGMVYGDLPAREVWALLPRPLRLRFDAIADRMAPAVASAPDSGLIHADLHLGNALFEHGRIKPIDFDDCGTGPRMYDIAVALWELRDEDRHEEYRAALLAGYRSVRDIDDRELDDYIAVRQVAFALWYTGSARLNPDFAARLDIVHRWSHDMLDLVGA